MSIGEKIGLVLMYWALQGTGFALLPEGFSDISINALYVMGMIGIALLLSAGKPRERS